MVYFNNTHNYCYVVFVQCATKLAVQFIPNNFESHIQCKVLDKNIEFLFLMNSSIFDFHVTYSMSLKIGYINYPNICILICVWLECFHIFNLPRHVLPSMFSTHVDRHIHMSQATTYVYFTLHIYVTLTATRFSIHV